MPLYSSLNPVPNVNPPPSAITAANKNTSCQKRMGNRRINVSEYKNSHESPSKNNLWNAVKKPQKTFGLTTIPTMTIKPIATASPTINHPPRLKP